MSLGRLNKRCKSFVNVAQQDKLLFHLIDRFENIVNLRLCLVNHALVANLLILILRFA